MPSIPGESPMLMLAISILVPALIVAPGKSASEILNVNAPSSSLLPAAPT